jgi:phosphoribosylformylglycinamidine cyclo-ligase
VQLSYQRPALFELIARGGPVIEDEMRRTFNLGVGLILVVESNAVQPALRTLAEQGENAWILGDVAEAHAGQEPHVEFRRE